jgi:hypothetical protein
MIAIIPPELWRFLTMEKRLSEWEARNVVSYYLLREESQIIDSLREIPDLARNAKEFRGKAR